MSHFFKLFLLLFPLLFAVGSANADLSLTEIKKQIGTALDNAYKGQGTKIETALETTQLLSCKTGIKDTTQLLTGLQIKLHKDWILKNPMITATADNYTATPLKQIRIDLPPSKKWTDTYNTSMVFPILLEGTPRQDIILTVKADWTLCPQEGEEESCVLNQQTYYLSLPVSESYSTVYCGYLSNALKTAAVDAEKTNMQIQNQLLPNGDLLLRFVFPKSNKSVELQTENSNQLKPITIQPGGNVWTFILKPSQPLSLKEKLPLLIRTTNGCYSANIQIDNQPLPPLKEELSVWSLFWMGLFLFILSPIWCYWLAPHKLTTKKNNLKQKITKLQIGYGLALILLWGCLSFKIPIYGWINFPVLDWIVLIGCFYLLFKPFQPIWIACILTVLMPKPFWETIINSSISAKTGFLIWAFCFAYFMFNIWKLLSKTILSVFKQYQKENIMAYHIFIRIPYIIIIIWFGLTLTASILGTTKLTLHEPLKQLAVIQVTNPTCWKCLKDRLFTFSTLGEIPIYQINSSEEWSCKKRKEYNINQQNFNIFLTSDDHEIILPKDLSRFELKQIIRRYY